MKGIAKIPLLNVPAVLDARQAGKALPLEQESGMHTAIPSGPYSVNFVFMHAGAPFAKKGDSELNLPKMDISISLLQWEVFLPEIYKVKDFGGDALAANLLPPGSQMPAFGFDAISSADTTAFASVSAATINLLRDGVTVNDVRNQQRIASNEASTNIVNFQRRAAGDLPIRVDVPRAGNSYRFIRTLVLDEETTVTFRYKSR